MPQRAATDPATKARALQRAAEVGAAQASRETGVPAATIRAWKSRAADTRPATTTTAASSPAIDGLDEFETRLLEPAKRAVEAGVQRLEELIPTAKGVQSIAISSGILIDKIRQLDQTIAEARERETRIAERDAALIVQSIEHYFEVLGLPFAAGSAARRTWGTLMRQVGNGEVWSVPPMAVEAVAELEREMRGRWGYGLRQEIRAELEPVIREEIAAEVRREARAEFEAEREREGSVQRALPAPVAEPDPEVPDESDVEVLSGEVVEEVSPASPRVASSVSRVGGVLVHDGVPSWRQNRQWRVKG